MCALSTKHVNGQGHAEDHNLPASTSQEELTTHIKQLNLRDDIHGILLQLPLPKHLNEKEAMLAIDPKKDADGFHPYNMGNLLIGNEDLCHVLLKE